MDIIINITITIPDHLTKGKKDLNLNLKIKILIFIIKFTLVLRVKTLRM